MMPAFCRFILAINPVDVACCFFALDFIIVA